VDAYGTPGCDLTNAGLSVRPSDPRSAGGREIRRRRAAAVAVADLHYAGVACCCRLVSCPAARAAEWSRRRSRVDLATGSACLKQHHAHHSTNARHRTAPAWLHLAVLS